MVRINAQRCNCGNREPSRFFDDSESGERVCEECGLVSLLPVESTPIVRTTRLGSVIDPSYANNSGGEFNLALRRSRRFIVPYHEANVWKRIVYDISNRSGIPEIVSRGVIACYETNREKFGRMRRRELATALLYIHTKNYLKGNKTLSEIAVGANANLKMARRYVLELGLENGLKTVYIPPEDYVALYGTRLNMDREVVERGIEFAKEYRETFVGASGPRTVAACSLYLASKENGHRHTQKELAQLMGIAEYTVREVSARMRQSMRRPYG